MTGYADTLTGGDPAGADTFGRYRYQSKLTLLHWLTTLAPGGPTAVYAEHHEDILIEFEDHLVFVQVKSRASAGGHWTAEIMCSDGGGIDSLCRAYAEARHLPCAFQLHLEGSTSPSDATVKFVSNCSEAGPNLRAAISRTLAAILRDRGKAATQGGGGEGEIEAHGDGTLDIDILEDFISRLSIVPNQPARGDVDARCIRALGRLLPSSSAGEIEGIHKDLLQRVETAQDASEPSADVDGSGDSFLRIELKRLSSAESEKEAADKRLTRELLIELLPTTPMAIDLLLFDRLLQDRPITTLETKLLAAGANDQVLQDARGLRAATEGMRFELLAGPDGRADLLEDVSNRVLMRARARAQLCKTAGESANDLWGASSYRAWNARR